MSMGVYIDMEMPESCGDCRLCGGIADTDCGPCAWCDVDRKSRVADTRRDCPLVPIPEPHGRLIDADAYGEILRGLGSRDYRREKGTICDAIKMLQPHYAPTVIPASEEGKT